MKNIWIVYDSFNGDMMGAFKKKPTMKDLQKVFGEGPDDVEIKEFLRDLDIISVELFE